MLHSLSLEIGMGTFNAVTARALPSGEIYPLAAQNNAKNFSQK
jgi:hypothetical protein